MGKNYIVPYIGFGSIFGNEEIQAVADTLLNSETLSCGPQRDQFEAEFSKFIGVKYAFAVTSCTVALEFVSHLIGLKAGDEVIATPFTYQATVQRLLTLPVKIRFCDIDPNSLCLDTIHLQSLITSRTRAIYLTHYGGLMADMDAIMELAYQNNIIVVEDCAHAHGSEYKGRKAGSIGHIGCFSFQSLKNMSTLGQGGMITFNNDEWATIIKRIRATEPHAVFKPNGEIQFGFYKKPIDDLDRHEKNAYTHDCIAIYHSGTNSTMSEPAAAVGRVQLQKLNYFNELRRNVAMLLDAGLSEIPGIRLQVEPTDYKHVYHLYTFFVEPDLKIKRDELAAALEEEGVQIVLRYFPIHLLPEWRYHEHRYGECPITEKIWFEHLINLPCYPSLTDEQINYMIEAVKKVVKKLSR